METSIELAINPQPDDSTCGPTCLQAVYAHFGDHMPLGEVISQVTRLENGGTLAVLLGCHALRRGYRARIYTYDLQIFDLTWFATLRPDLPAFLADKLTSQLSCKDNPRLRAATTAFLDYLKLGGEVRFQDLDADFLRRHLKRGKPILAGLSATYLYRTAREIDVDGELLYDDVCGEPAGHFVVLSGYDMERRTVRVSDPLHANPLGGHHYEVGMRHLINAIMLGILTYDANLLILEPGEPRAPGQGGTAGTQTTKDAARPRAK